MPFEIVRNDIINMDVDAIVNTANPRPVIGAGTDARIHEMAGPSLLEARQRIGKIGVGEAYITPGFDLRAKYVIHTVGPVWRGGLFSEAKQLRQCYESALALAAEHGCKSIAFPLISTGNYGFPKDKALRIAMDVFHDFLMEQDMQIWLVVFDREAFRLSEKLHSSIASYIDEHYVDIQKRKQRFSAPLQRRNEDFTVCASMPMEYRAAPCAAPKIADLEELLEQTDAGFSETLLKLIDQTGKKDAQVYTKANVSRQHFSKIRNNPHYKPTKATAIAFAIALELDLEQTKDLIGRAGYALTMSSKFDVIIQYFIEQGNYDLFEINAALYRFDQSLLGGVS